MLLAMATSFAIYVIYKFIKYWEIDKEFIQMYYSIKEKI